MKRRTFIHSTLGTLGVLSTPAFSSASLPSSPLKKYNIGIIGHTGRGNYGHGLDTAWLDFPHCKITAVADAHSGGLQQASKRLKVSNTYSDYLQMFEKEKLDIVSICPRWIDQHAEMMIEAAQRGIHILIEKPFCRDLTEADKVVKVLKEKNVKLALAIPTLYSPKYERVKTLIKEGAIGKVLELRGRGKEDRRGGGEDLWVLGTHIMAMIYGINGLPSWCFAEVTDKGERVTKKHVYNGAEGIGPLAGDSIQATFGMKNGITAYFNTNRNQRGNPSRFGLQIYGSKGVIEILEAPMPEVKILQDSSWSPGRSRKNWKNVSSAGIDQPEPLKGDAFKRNHYAIQSLLKAIENDTQAKAGYKEGLAANEMIAAVFESHRLNQPVTLPLKTRENPLSLLR